MTFEFSLYLGLMCHTQQNVSRVSYHRKTLNFTANTWRILIHCTSTPWESWCTIRRDPDTGGVNYRPQSYRISDPCLLYAMCALCPTSFHILLILAADGRRSFFSRYTTFNYWKVFSHKNQRNRGTTKQLGVRLGSHSSTAVQDINLRVRVGLSAPTVDWPQFGLCSSSERA